MEQVRIHIIDSFGEPMILEGRLVGERPHGFNTPGGGWSCYGRKGYERATFVLMIPKGKRKYYSINKNRVTLIETLSNPSPSTSSPE